MIDLASWQSLARKSVGQITTSLVLLQCMGMDAFVPDSRLDQDATKLAINHCSLRRNDGILGTMGKLHNRNTDHFFWLDRFSSLFGRHLVSPATNRQQTKKTSLSSPELEQLTIYAILYSYTDKAEWWTSFSFTSDSKYFSQFSRIGAAHNLPDVIQTKQSVGQAWALILLSAAATDQQKHSVKDAYKSELNRWQGDAEL
jgi:hypothetical protein